MAAVDTFCRTMRRLEKRARAAAVPVDAFLRSLRTWRQDADPSNLRAYASAHRTKASTLRWRDLRKQNQRIAFLLERAADAVDRYAAARAKEAV